MKVGLATLSFTPLVSLFRCVLSYLIAKRICKSTRADAKMERNVVLCTSVWRNRKGRSAFLKLHSNLPPSPVLARGGGERGLNEQAGKESINNEVFLSGDFAKIFITSSFFFSFPFSYFFLYEKSDGCLVGKSIGKLCFGNHTRNCE